MREITPKTKPEDLVLVPEPQREQYAVLVNELAERGVKVSPEKVLRICKTPYTRVLRSSDGTVHYMQTSPDDIVFLEMGNTEKGFVHAEDRFISGLSNLNIGITRNRVPDVVSAAVREGKFVAI